MTAPSLRKLAEEIVTSTLSESTTASPADLCDWTESRLRSALPELSGLLGELAVAREALEWIASQGCEFPSEPCDDETTGEEFCRSCRAREALSSDAGRLAGEALVALLEWYETPGHDCRSDEENVLQQMAAQLRVEFPGIDPGGGGTWLESY